MRLFGRSACHVFLKGRGGAAHENLEMEGGIDGEREEVVLRETSHLRNAYRPNKEFAGPVVLTLLCKTSGSKQP